MGRLSMTQCVCVFVSPTDTCSLGEGKGGISYCYLGAIGHVDRKAQKISYFNLKTKCVYAAHQHSTCDLNLEFIYRSVKHFLDAMYQTPNKTSPLLLPLLLSSVDDIIVADFIPT